jgi:hypothetical protein
MYNKISSLILNSGKASGLADIYVAQPDSLKEELAGKTFIIADLSLKKNEGRKVMDFLISRLEENYYNDGKILLRDKIEGLKIENIFEAAISKTNQELADFLAKERIRLNPSASSLTIGVVCENKLHFSGFGRNRALLVYKHGENYEIINVETSASEYGAEKENQNNRSALFSSVISGEIPPSSYFVFTSEAFSEYLPDKDLLAIVTKLPPIVATEQMKNILGKINSFIPFLGIIIKNTVGLEASEMREENEKPLSAQGSISSLNRTEQKTERMLEPAGLINLSKIYKEAKRQLQEARAKKAAAAPKKIYRPEIEDSRPITSKPAVNPEIGRINSLATASLNNIARSDSFMIKEKIVFKKKPGMLATKLKGLMSIPAAFFRPRAWNHLGSSAKNWLSFLDNKNKRLAVILIAIIAVFGLSLGFGSYHKKQQANTERLNNLVADIESRQDSVDAFILYNNEAGARTSLEEISALLASLPQKKTAEIETYQRLAKRYQEQADKIQKITHVSQPEKISDLAGLNATNLIFADKKLYAAAGATIHAIDPKVSGTSPINPNGATALEQPYYDEGSLYYLNSNQLLKMSIKDNASSLFNIPNETSTSAKSYRIFNNKLYTLSPVDNQIYSSAIKDQGYGAKAPWLKETADLSQTTDLAIDGNVYILKADGSIIRFRTGRSSIGDSKNFPTAPISPVMSAANKVIVDQGKTGNLYILESASKRLAIIDKTSGALIGQYQLDSLNSVKDVAIDETNKTAYFLADEAIYRIALP